MTLYGFLYFLAHDGLVHRRWPFRHVPRRGYLKRLYQAHRLHHAVQGKEGCVSFGFLWAPTEAGFQRELQQVRRQTRHSERAAPELLRTGAGTGQAGTAGEKCACDQ